MEFFMVCHYIYDGEGRHEVDYIMPCSLWEYAFRYLTDVVRDEDDYDWVVDKNDELTAFHSGPGRYAYDYYYIEPMTMDEEI